MTNGIKFAMVASLIVPVAACTTVTTYDRRGGVTGSCRISGILRGGGSCIGYASDGGSQFRDQRQVQPTAQSKRTIQDAAEMYDPSIR